MKKKVVLSSVLTIALCVALIAGSTFALFTSESKVNIAVTAGKVDVTATIESLQTYSMGEATDVNGVFENGGTAAINGGELTLDKVTPGDEVSCNIKIVNNSNVTIQYRTVITKVTDNGLWKGLEAEIDSVVYDGTSKVSTWATLEPGSADIVVPVSILLPVEAGNEYQEKSCKLAYTVEAVQGNADVTDAPAADTPEAETYYTVATVDEFKALSGKILADGAVIDIVSDIDLAGAEIPALAAAYGGTLTVNGNSNVISNVSVKTPGTHNGMANYGLFYVHTNGTLTINNLIIDNVTVEATSDNYGAAVVVGYADGGSTVNLNNVDVKNSTVKNDYDEAAVFVSYCTGNINMKGCDVIDCTVQGEAGDSRKTSVGIGHLNGGTAILDTCTENNPNYDWCHRNDGNLIIVENGIYNVDNDKGLDLSIKKGASKIALGSGNYIIPDSAQGKTLTIVGNGVDSVVATQDDGSYEGCDYSLDGATVTFEGITINTDSSTYTGYARMKGTYNNCTINGTYTLYGESVFNGCTFNVSGDCYNIWTWGAGRAEFNNCTFNTDGKSILVYNSNCDVYVNGCTFNDRTNGTGFTKTALETGVDNTNTSYNIYITDTVVNGLAENDKCVGYQNIVGNKNSMPNDKLNIVVDGVDVY